MLPSGSEACSAQVFTPLFTLSTSVHSVFVEQSDCQHLFLLDWGLLLARASFNFILFIYFIYLKILFLKLFTIPFFEVYTIHLNLAESIFLVYIPLILVLYRNFAPT